MTLTELLTSVRINLYDASNGLDYWTDARLTPKVNDAIHVVRQLLLATTPTYEYGDVSLEVANPDSDNYVLYAASSFPQPVKKLVHASRTGTYATSHDTPFLKIVEFAEIENELEAALQDLPPIFIYNGGVGFVQPPIAAFNVRIAYFAEPAELVTGSDTCSLPTDTTPLIAALTTAFCMAAENRDATAWTSLFTQISQAMGLYYNDRDDTPESP